MANEAIKKVLTKLETCINENKYEIVENDFIELKDLSGGQIWPSFYETVCAFLNTKGGFIIVGIKEDVKNKRYILKGFHPEDIEFNLKKDIFNEIVDENGRRLPLKDYFSYSIVDFLEKQIVIVEIKPLSENLKFVFHNQTAYKRQLDADLKISELEIENQIKLKTPSSNLNL